MKHLNALVMAMFHFKYVINPRSLNKVVLPTTLLVLVCFGTSLQVRADTLNITGLISSITPTGVETGVGDFAVDGTSTGISR